MIQRLLLVTTLSISACAGCKPTVVGTTSNKFLDSDIVYFAPLTTTMTPPPPTKLQVGDRIRILRVPDADLKQRDDEVARGAEMAGHTADTIDRIVAENPIVKIWQIDEFGYPWYEVSLIANNGEFDEHTLMVYDDGTWEKVEE